LSSFDHAFLNFVDLYNSLGETVYFGQWGASHVYQREYNQVFWLGVRLNSQDSPVSGRVLTIQSAYSGAFASGALDPVLEGCSLPFQELAKGDVTLFALTGDQSPFAHNLYLIPRNSRGVTTDYMQLLAYFGKMAPYSIR